MDIIVCLLFGKDLSDSFLRFFVDETLYETVLDILKFDIEIGIVVRFLISDTYFWLDISKFIDGASIVENLRLLFFVKCCFAVGVSKVRSLGDIDFLNVKDCVIGENRLFYCRLWIAFGVADVIIVGA